MISEHGLDLDLLKKFHILLDQKTPYIMQLLLRSRLANSSLPDDRSEYFNDLKQRMVKLIRRREKPTDSHSSNHYCQISSWKNRGSKSIHYRGEICSCRQVSCGIVHFLVPGTKFNSIKS